jgi:hypothetical protein
VNRFTIGYCSPVVDGSSPLPVITVLPRER